VSKLRAGDAGHIEVGGHVIPGQRRRGGTATRILEAAEREVQARGFASFSYASVAAELRITKAALHYHFPGKAELGLALITRYAARFAGALAKIDATAVTVRAKLDAYIDLYAAVLGESKMCLCGMLAAEYETLPEPMRAEVVKFFDDNERWLTAVLAGAAAEDSIRLSGDAQGSAALIFSAVEGAMLVARPYGDPEKLRAVAAALLAGLTGTAA
jgi:TetR/AcrR family transcriptional regulator, transcriptional repressor for nem operon